MRSISILAGTTLAALSLAACASNGPPGSDPMSPSAERGQRLAERRCAGCHAVGLDQSPAASGPRFSDLHLRYNALSLQKRFAEITEHGSGEMPPIHISRQDAEDLVAYFETLGG